MTQNPTVGTPIQKSWGVTVPLYLEPDLEVWSARINAGGESSWHCHRCKHNRFWLRSGTLRVTSPRSETEMVAGAVVTIRAREWHGFQAVTDCHLWEVYFSQTPGSCDPLDITRFPADFSTSVMRSKFSQLSPG